LKVLLRIEALLSIFVNGVFTLGVRDAYVLWHSVDDGLGMDLDEWFETRPIPVSLPGAWALFVEPAVRRTKVVSPDAVEPLGDRERERRESTAKNMTMGMLHKATYIQA
jgi:hypothetical protein